MQKYLFYKPSYDIIMVLINLLHLSAEFKKVDMVIIHVVDSVLNAEFKKK